MSEKAKIISIISGKGGVGKTTVTSNLILSLSLYRKKKVLVIDMDIGNLFLALGIEENFYKTDIIDVIYEHKPLPDAIHQYNNNLYFMGLKNRNNLDKYDTNKFVSYIETLKDKFDIIIFDVGAGINGNFKKSVAASNLSIFVIEPTVLNYKIAERTYFKMREELNFNIPCFLIINKYDKDMAKRKIIMDKDKIISTFKMKLIGVLPFEEKNIKYLNNKTPYYLSKDDKTFFTLYNNTANRLLNELEGM